MLELAKENHLDLKDLSIRRLLIMRYNAKKIRASWAEKNMPRLGGDDHDDTGHATELALAFAATVRCTVFRCVCARVHVLTRRRMNAACTFVA